MSGVQQVSHVPVVTNSPVSREGDSTVLKGETLSCRMIQVSCIPECTQQADVVLCMSGRNCRTISLCNTDPPEKKKRVVDKYLAILRRPMKSGKEEYPEIEKKTEAMRIFVDMRKDGAVAIPYLMAFLQSTTPELQEAAVAALGNLGVQEALPQILTLAKESPYSSIKAVALEAVSKLK